MLVVEEVHSVKKLGFKEIVLPLFILKFNFKVFICSDSTSVCHYCLRYGSALFFGSV